MTRRFAAARAAGFDGIEIQVLHEAPIPEIVDAARAAALPIILLNVGMGDFLSGGCGLSGVPGRESAFLEAFEETLSVARQLDAQFIHVGPSRTQGNQDRSDCLKVLKSNILTASALIGNDTVKLLVEPLNILENRNILHHDVDETAQWLRQELPGIGYLMFDAYHIALSGRPVIETLERNLDIVKHVQFSDAPGRTAPGVGNLGYPDLLWEIEAAGYGGWLGAEYLSQQRTPDSLGWLSAYRNR